MRPASIVMFERFFLASLVVSIVSFFLSYGQLGEDPTLRQAGMGTGLVTGLMAVSIALYLLLWFFIARKGSSVAKWILTVLTALGIASLVYTLATVGVVWNFVGVLSLAYYVLAVAAVTYLFKPDTAAWFKGETPADPTAFD
jgi:hypothetical protein